MISDSSKSLRENSRSTLRSVYFSQTRLQYLGQIIDSEGIRKDPSKVEAITDMAEPLDIASLKRFLGLVNQLM